MSLDMSKVLQTERITIVIEPNMPLEGQRVLDIGGGGEGIISTLYKEKVVAIDIRPDELNEMEESRSLKIVMDATKLAFTDHQFDRATAFFSFMYMTDVEIIKAIEEVHRVLKTNGSLEIWDIEMPSTNDVEADIFIVQLDVRLNEKTIETGYGVQLKEEQQTMGRFSALLNESGFKIGKSFLYENGIFYLEAVK